MGLLLVLLLIGTLYEVSYEVFFKALYPIDEYKVRARVFNKVIIRAASVP